MPAMNGAAIQAAFKVLAKLIYLGQKGPTDATTYRTTMSGLVDQCASGSANDANAITNIAAPGATLIGNVATTLDGVTAQAKTLVKQYLERVMAVDQGRPAGTDFTVVGAQLVTDMTTAAQSCAPSGGNLNGIKWYFASNFGLIFPESGSPTIPDSWITATPN